MRWSENRPRDLWWLSFSKTTPIIRSVDSLFLFGAIIQRPPVNSHYRIRLHIAYNSKIAATPRTVPLVQWFKPSAWKIGDREFEPHSGLQVSKKQNVSFLLTCKDSILCGAFVTESSMLCLRPLGLAFRILCLQGSVISPSSVSSPGLAYMCTNVA